MKKLNDTKANTLSTSAASKPTKPATATKKKATAKRTPAKKKAVQAKPAPTAPNPAETVTYNADMLTAGILTTDPDVLNCGAFDHLKGTQNEVKAGSTKLFALQNVVITKQVLTCTYYSFKVTYELHVEFSDRENPVFTRKNTQTEKTDIKHGYLAFIGNVKANKAVSASVRKYIETAK